MTEQEILQGLAEINGGSESSIYAIVPNLYFKDDVAHGAARWDIVDLLIDMDDYEASVIATCDTLEECFLYLKDNLKERE